MRLSGWDVLSIVLLAGMVLIISKLMSMVRKSERYLIIG